MLQISDDPAPVILNDHLELISEQPRQEELRQERNRELLRIRTLAENTATSKSFGAEHGLSFLIDTGHHHLLFDTGASHLFAKNADVFGADLSQIDVVVVSHGHSDHGGGLPTFLTLNEHAPAYVHEAAFDSHWSMRPGGELKYIGLDQSLKDSRRLIQTGDHHVIDEELELFADVRAGVLIPSGNRHLMRKQEDRLVPDDFRHEQNLVIHEQGKMVLVAGCAHRGIINIMEACRELTGRMPDAVISGFHLDHPAHNSTEDPETIAAIGRYLSTTGSKLYTCHCTGPAPYRTLKDLLGDQIDYLGAGSEIVL